MSKNISLKQEAYDALKSLQLAGESFSDTIIRLKLKFGSLIDIVGSGKLSESSYENEIKDLEKLRNDWR